MIIYLLRHAMAELSEHAGSEPVLTVAGREQAEQLAIRLRGSDIRRFLSSPARRCLETLTPLVEAMPGAEIESDPRLLEGATLSGILDVVESLEEELERLKGSSTGVEGAVKDELKSFADCDPCLERALVDVT